MGKGMILLMPAALAGCVYGVVAWQKPGAADADFKRDSYKCERDVRSTIHVNRVSGSDLFDRCMQAAGWSPARRGEGFPSIAF